MKTPVQKLILFGSLGGQAAMHFYNAWLFNDLRPSIGGVHHHTYLLKCQTCLYHRLRSPAGTGEYVSSKPTMALT